MTTGDKATGKSISEPLHRKACDDLVDAMFFPMKLLEDESRSLPALPEQQ